MSASLALFQCAAAVIQRSGTLIMTCSLVSYQTCQIVCVGKKKRVEEKSIGFHYVVGQCHWPVNDPVTAEVQGRHKPTLNCC